MAEQQKSVDRIADALVRRQIRLIQTALGLGRGYVGQLNRIEPAVRQLMVARLERFAKDPVTFGKTTRNKIRALIKAIDKLQNPTWVAIEQSLRKDLLEIAKQEVGFIEATVTKSLPVVVPLATPLAVNLRKLTFNEPAAGATVNQWTKDVRRADRNKIINAVQIGLAQGDTANQIATRLFGTIRNAGEDGTRIATKRQLQGITQTSINSVTNQARENFYALNTDVFTHVIYTATLDGRTTAICRSLDGKKFKTNEGPIPPIHFNCRSLRLPDLAVFKFASRPATGATEGLLKGLTGKARRDAVFALTGQVPATTTYRTFLRRQTVGFQNEVLGVKKAKLFRVGKLDLDKFVNETGRELTIGELRNRSVHDPAIATAFRLAGV